MSIPEPRSRPVRAKPALKLVKTEQMPREVWLQVRQQGIGSSDAAAAVGLHPYKSPLQLWLEKTGRVETSAASRAPTDGPLYWGALLEPLVAAHYTRCTGRRVRRVNAVLQHPDCPWMLANLDREVVASDEVQILECKTAGIQGSRLWQDGVPEYVQLQVLHQLAVTGRKAADVAVLLGGQEMRIHRIERDEGMIAHLVALEQAFWACVQEDRPPPADGSASSAQALLSLFPHGNGRTLELRDDRVMNALFSDYLDVRQQLGKYEALESQLRQSLQQRMGDATQMRLEQGSVSWKPVKASEVLDGERLAQEHPQLAQRYTRPRAASRRFSVKVFAEEPSHADPADGAADVPVDVPVDGSGQ